MIGMFFPFGFAVFSLQALSAASGARQFCLGFAELILDFLFVDDLLFPSSASAGFVAIKPVIATPLCGTMPVVSFTGFSSRRGTGLITFTLDRNAFPLTLLITIFLRACIVIHRQFDLAHDLGT